VKPAPFKYASPESIQEATAVLDQYGDEAKILAGGQSLIPLMNMRLARPEVLVDINRIPDLDGIERNGGLTIGATARHAAVMKSPEVTGYAPILAEAMRHVGHVGIRTRGTFGGATAHADPASEIPAIVLALDGEVVVTGPSGERTIRADEFFVSTFTTELGDNELVTAVRLPYQTDQAAWSFHEISRRHGDFALVGVAAVAELDGSGKVAKARIALSGVADTPVRATDAEDALVGQSLADGAEEAGRLAEQQLDPSSDFHASSTYRKQVARALVTRALTEMATKGNNR
jgi:CO/xanthine dehydrogenase FAD-binding subunit